MQTGSWGAPPPRCHAADRAAHVPKTRVRRARCVYGPHTSLRGDTGRGDARSWEQTMDPASTPADHGPPSRACNRAASKNGGRPMHPPAPAQGRSTKALGWCQHHGDRSHGGRAPGPSRRSPQASSSSSARSCRCSAGAGQRGPRAVFSAREISQVAQQVARAPSRASPSTRDGVRSYNFMPR